MSLSATMQVARWEFLRYLKLKQQLVGLILTFVMGLVGVGVVRLAQRDADAVRDVAVIGSSLALNDTEQLRFSSHEPAQLDSLRAAVAAGELAGIVVIEGTDEARLIMRRRAEWSADVRSSLAVARQQQMLGRAGIRPDELARLLAPPEVSVSYEAGSDREERGARVALIILLSLMIFAVFIGMSYIFASITGEKQIRVTEQVVSAIPAQAWIDGKIIGIIGVSLVSVGNTAIALGALTALIARGRIALPATLGDPLTYIVVIAFTLLGLCFWFAFLAAIAAMIDDPHNSTRGSFLFIPVLATALAFMVRGEPDGTFARVLSLLPPTAPAAMPTRIVAGGAVSAVELLISLALLMGGVWLLRRAAGRVFRLAMLMYGKEPTWAEVRRWVIAPDPTR